MTQPQIPAREPLVENLLSFYAIELAPGFRLELHQDGPDRTQAAYAVQRPDGWRIVAAGPSPEG